MEIYRTRVRVAPLAALLSLFIFTPQTGQAQEWSSWKYMGSQSDVALYWKTRQRSCGTNVRFKATNNSSVSVWPIVLDKRYNCREGGSDTRSEESVGSTNLAPGDSSSTVADTCLCGDSGGIKSVNVNLKVKAP